MFLFFHIMLERKFIQNFWKLLCLQLLNLDGNQFFHGYRWNTYFTMFWIELFYRVHPVLYYDFFPEKLPSQKKKKI